LGRLSGAVDQVRRRGPGLSLGGCVPRGGLPPTAARSRGLITWAGHSPS